MRGGATFVGDGIQVEIALDSDKSLYENPPLTGESPAFPASMTVTGGSSQLTIEGVYECGP